MFLLHVLAVVPMLEPSDGGAAASGVLREPRGGTGRAKVLTRKDARALGERELRDLLQRLVVECRGNLAEVARRMGMSVRSLQRQLADGGKSYKEVVAETRLVLAKRLLEETAHSLAEVAFLLGFSQPSAFHRAFKRWTGKTPAEWRAEA